MEAQVWPALEGNREITTDYRFTIIGKFLLEGLLSFEIIGIALVRKKKVKISSTSLFFLVMAISASLPMIISLKQRSYYLVPAFPFLAMAAAVVIFPFVKKILIGGNPTFLRLTRTSGVLTICAVLVNASVHFGKYSRNEDLIHDAELLAKDFPAGTIFSTPAEDWHN